MSTQHFHTPIDLPTTLLGGMTPQQFMKRHWQKKPLLIRQAIKGFVPPVDRKALFELASQAGVESRLVLQPQAQTRKNAAWQLRHGPFSARQLPSQKSPGWTLLVQGVDLHMQAVHALLQRFRFVPDARLDDIMISWASDQGGVGPHFDSYDVFLLQAQGRRRWRIAPPADQTLVPDMPVKILSNFQAVEEYVLEPGDMLYLPPLWGHDGVAEGTDCMTYSVGFRVPQRAGLAAEVVQRMAESFEDERLYRDPTQPATATPALMPQGLVEFARDAVNRLSKDEDALRMALGEVMTEPKPNVWFEGKEVDEIDLGLGVQLDRRTRMLYDERCIYINGESFRAGGADAKLMRRLADARTLTPRDLQKSSADAQSLLLNWVQDGWLHQTDLIE
jgi:50S ribosomal protein L16 3-hydroxylase